MKIYWKGKLRAWNQVVLSPINTGLFYGENIFEAIPVYGGKALFLRDHLQRLKNGCEFLRWPFLPEKEFQKAIRIYSKALGSQADFMIRFNLVQELKDQVNPRVFVRNQPALFATIRPLRHRLEDTHPQRGKIGISPWTAPDSRTFPNWFKISSYMTTRAVFRDHPEWVEILRLNRLGEVVDGGVSTPMWFQGEKLFVPPLHLGGLESVTRTKIIGLCRKLGIKIVQKPWKIKDLFKKGELFFVGSGVGILSPTHLMGKKINKYPELSVRLWNHYRLWADRNSVRYAGNILKAL